MTESLAGQADDFADRLNKLFRPALGSAVRFGVTEIADVEKFMIGPEPFDTHKRGYSRIPMRRRDETGAPRLELTVTFQCGPDPEHRWLAVYSSTFGPWIRAGDGSPRPVVRIEYDRSATKKPRAHVHFHAESTEIGWLYGAAGKPVPRMAELHFPLGGDRFRPSIEDFLRFIDTEGLFRDWAEPQTWRQVRDESLREWEYRQARATVRRHRDAAIDQLEDEGFVVTRREAEASAAQP